MGRDFVVGVIFLISLALLIFAAVIVRGIPTGADLYELTVTFDSVSGLKKGDNIRIRGLQMGEVSDVSYATDGIEVTVLLYERVPPLEGHQFMVLPASALGGNFIDYLPGEGAEVATTDLRGTGSTDLLVEAGRFLRENGSRLATILDDISDLTVALRDGQGVLGKVIMEKELAASFTEIVNDVKDLAQKTNSGENALSVLIDNPDVAENLEETIRNIADLVARAQDEGSGISVLVSQESGERFDRIIAEFDQLIVGLREQKSVVGKLLHSEIMGDRASEIADNLARTTRALANPVGTVGRLLHSDELYVDLRRAVQYFRDGAEDIREQAPVNTFLNALFNAL